MTYKTVIDNEGLIKTKNPPGLTQTLILVGAFFGIHPWAIIISMPLYTIGLVLLWRNKALIKKAKLKWTFLPILGIFIIWAIIVLLLVIYEYSQ